MTGQIIFDTLVALFAAIGIACLVWMLLGVLIRPKEYKNMCACTLLAADTDAASIAEAVHALTWYNGAFPDDRKLVVLDYGASGKDTEFVCAMEAKYRQVIFLKPSQLEAYIESMLVLSTDGDVDGKGTDTAHGDG